MNKVIILTGASGNIGNKIYGKIKKQNCHGLYFKKKIKKDKKLIKLDLRNEKSVKSLLKKIKPCIIIHTAGMKNPQLNEKYPIKSKNLNLKVTRNLVSNLNKKTHFIFFSTDKVYDGKKKNYNEKSKALPMGLYGKYKLKCEVIIKKKFRKHHIIRMPLVHFNGSNKDFSIIDRNIFLLNNKKKVVVFKNIERCFVDVDDLVRFVTKLMKNKKYGTYNIGSKLSTYSDRVKKICKKQKIDFKKNLIEVIGNIKPISMQLDTKKLVNNFNFKFT